jgi:hypothetical protein
MEIIKTEPRLRGATLEGISANLYGGSIKIAMPISAPAAISRAAHGDVRYSKVCGLKPDFA